MKDLCIGKQSVPCVLVKKEGCWTLQQMHFWPNYFLHIYIWDGNNFSIRRVINTHHTKQGIMHSHVSCYTNTISSFIAPSVVLHRKACIDLRINLMLGFLRLTAYSTKRWSRIFQSSSGTRTKTTALEIDLIYSQICQRVVNILCPWSLDIMQFSKIVYCIQHSATWVTCWLPLRYIITLQCDILALMWL